MIKVNITSKDYGKEVFEKINKRMFDYKLIKEDN